VASTRPVVWLVAITAAGGIMAPGPPVTMNALVTACWEKETRFMSGTGTVLPPCFADSRSMSCSRLPVHTQAATAPSSNSALPSPALLSLFQC